MEKLPQHPSAATRLAIHLVCLSVAVAGCALYTRLHASTATKPLVRPAAVPSVIEAPKPVTITQNTVAGRRVRFVSSDEHKPAQHSEQLAQL